MSASMSPGRQCRRADCARRPCRRQRRHGLSRPTPSTAVRPRAVAWQHSCGESPGEHDNAWWNLDPVRLKADQAAVRSAFPSFQLNRDGGDYRWQGVLDTGRGRYRIASQVTAPAPPRSSGPCSLTGSAVTRALAGAHRRTFIPAGDFVSPKPRTGSLSSTRRRRRSRGRRTGSPPTPTGALAGRGRPTGTGPTSRDRQSPVTAADDALPAIEAISTWINNADTKIGLLGIVDTALIGAFVAQHDRARTVLNHANRRDTVGVVLLALGVVALVTSILYLLRALQPRLDSYHPSRFAFPWVADADLADLMAGDHEKIRREAWIQAQTLSRIVRAKHEGLRRALPCAVLAGALLVSWLIVVPTA